MHTVCIQVELKCTEPTSGGYYYPEHLPLLGEHTHTHTHTHTQCPIPPLTHWHYFITHLLYMYIVHVPNMYMYIYMYMCIQNVCVYRLFLLLAVLGAPRPLVDPAAVSTGDLVRVELEPEVFRAVQEGHGGWNDMMLNVRRLTHTIHTCTCTMYMYIHVHCIYSVLSSCSTCTVHMYMYICIIESSLQ